MPRYTRRDEYALLRGRCARWAGSCQARSPGSRFAVYVDTNHHVDREAAARAGIAVYGKNTLAITRRHGSWVVLGVLVTDAELAPTQAAPEQPAWDACGECRACIDACPTDAIVGDGVLDARRCLSYLSQSRLAELPFAAAFEDRVYGCDICQDVCPWNRGAERRAAGPRAGCRRRGLPAAWPSGWRPSRSELADRYRRLYIPDRDGRQLQRNARVALANVSERSAPPLNGAQQLERAARARSRARAAGRAPRRRRGSLRISGTSQSASRS